MKAKLEADGERMVPEHHKGRNMYGAHLTRYKAALPVIAGKIVLDIACGSGYGTKLMSAQAKRIYGVDVSDAAVSYARTHFNAPNITYKTGDGKKIPLDDNSVDVVVSYETLEHVDGYKDFLKEIKRVLKPEGVLLLSTPNSAEYPKGNHFHFREFNHKELVTMLGEHFSTIKEYFQTYWVYSTLLPADLQASEWDKDLRTLNTCKATPAESLYFFMVCTNNKKDTTTIENFGAIGEAYRPVLIQKQKQAENEAVKKATREKIKSAEKEINALRKELSVIKSSKAWKLTRSMQKTSGGFKKLLGR